MVAEQTSLSADVIARGFDWLRYQEAVIFATRAHGSQMYGQMPYLHHLEAVCRQLFIYCFHPTTPSAMRKLPLDVCEDLLIACLLHDTIEDTDVTEEDLREKFGDRVANLVWAVTNGTISEQITDKAERRKAKFATVYPKIRSTPYALIVKLCDRIANFESCLGFRLTKDRQKVIKLLGMYQAEFPAFEAELYIPSDTHLERMWSHLRDLSKRKPTIDPVKFFI